MLALALLLGTVVALFSIQHGSRTTQLSLDIGFAAWQLDRAVPIPLLMAACAGGGLLLGAVPMGVRAYSRGRRVKQLERALATQDARSERPW